MLGGVVTFSYMLSIKRLNFVEDTNYPLYNKIFDFKSLDLLDEKIFVSLKLKTFSFENSFIFIIVDKAK